MLFQIIVWKIYIKSYKKIIVHQAWLNPLFFNGDNTKKKNTETRISHHRWATVVGGKSGRYDI